jgi:hypothetical protein
MHIVLSARRVDDTDFGIDSSHAREEISHFANTSWIGTCLRHNFMHTMTGKMAGALREIPRWNTFYPISYVKRRLQRETVHALHSPEYNSSLQM